MSTGCRTRLSRVAAARQRWLMALDVALMADQRGLVTRGQALGGLSRAAIEHRLRPGGPWQVVLPAVYASFTGELATHQRWIAALLFGGPACLLGGATAVALHGLRQGPRSRQVHLLMPHKIRRANQGFVRIRRTTSMPPPMFFDDLRAVPVGRAVVDACRELVTLDQVRGLVAESVQRRKATAEDIAAEVARGASAGSALITRALAEVFAGTRSVAESYGRALLEGSALPRPVWNRDLFTATGEWLACPDAWWCEAGVVLEVDSREWHLLPEHWAATLRRHARMTSYGLLVVHVTPRQLREQPIEVLEMLGRTLAQGRARPTPPVTDVPPAGWRKFA